MEEFGYFGDLFRRLKYNYKKPFKSDWEYIGMEGSNLGAVNGKVRFAHPAKGWPTWGTTSEYQERMWNGENVSCTSGGFGGDPSPGIKKGCYRYNPGQGQRRCSHPSLLKAGKCTDDITGGTGGSCANNNIGAQPSDCRAPDELGKPVPYVITQALFETDDFPYWQFEKTMTRNL